MNVNDLYRILEESLLYGAAAALTLITNATAGTAFGPVVAVTLGLGISAIYKVLKGMGVSVPPSSPSSTPSPPSVNGKP